MCPSFVRIVMASQRLTGNSRILKWRYVSTIFEAIFCGDISPYIGLIQALYMLGTSNLGSWNSHCLRPEDMSQGSQVPIPEESNAMQSFMQNNVPRSKKNADVTLWYR